MNEKAQAHIPDTADQKRAKRKECNANSSAWGKANYKWMCDADPDYSKTKSRIYRQRKKEKAEQLAASR